MVRTPSKTVRRNASSRAPALLSGLLVGLVAFGQAGCGTPKKPAPERGDPPEQRGTGESPKGVSEAEVRERLTTAFRRGYQHGQLVMIGSLLVSTRSYEPVWEASLQSFQRLPSLVPYLLGFLDSLHKDDSADYEARRIARQQIPSVRVPRDQLRDRCLLTLAKLVRLARSNAKLEDRLVPEKFRAELREAVAREARTAELSSESSRNAIELLGWRADDSAMPAVLTLLDQAVVAGDTATVRAAAALLSKRTYRPAGKSFKEAFRQPSIKDPGLRALLLQGAAACSPDADVLGLASVALGPEQPLRLRLAAAAALGTISRSTALTKRALETLARVVRDGRTGRVRSACVEAIASSGTEAALAELRALDKDFTAQPAGAGKLGPLVKSRLTLLERELEKTSKP